MKNKIPIAFIEGNTNNFQIDINNTHRKRFHVQKWSNPNYPNLPLHEIPSIKPLIPSTNSEN